MTRRIAGGSPARPPGGFTLVELIAVVAIMIIVMAFLVPSLNSINSGRDIERAGSQVLDAMATARQSAMAEGFRVRWELADIGLRERRTTGSTA